ncbi:MAG: glycosyltransferase family 4 protein [Desulfovibrio sp.]|nr:glycosyltransferase family 4 protein [Desulfovibrio sp.]
MKNAIFGSIHSYFETGDIYGRKVANSGFIGALFAADPFAEYHFFEHDTAESRTGLQAYKDLPAVARGAVRIFSRANLAAKLATVEYHCFHMADPLGDQAALAVLRNRVAPKLFPITSVNHSINYIHYGLAFLPQIWPGATPREVIGASSRAAATVIKGYFTQLRENYALPETWGEPAVRIIPLGVDTERFASPKDAAYAGLRRDARARLDAGADETVCLVHGRITVDDKMDLLPLLQALRRVREIAPGNPVRLVVSGRPRAGDRYVQVLQATAKAMKIPFNLVTDPDETALRGLYAAADIFSSPSDNLQESFGLTMLEAAAAGLPVVASDWDGYRDLVQDGVTGLLVPTLAPAATPFLDDYAHCLPDNIHQLCRAQQTALDVPALASAIARLAKDKALRRSMGEAGRAMSQKFTWRSIVDRWLACWDDLWAASIPPQKEVACRKARHPANLDFARLFGRHPSTLLRYGDAAPADDARMPEETAPEIPAGDLTVRTSARGDAVRGRKDVCVTWMGLEHCLEGVDIRRMLVLARHPVTVEALADRLCDGGEEKTKSPGATPETACFAILWGLKHDLLEIVTS